MSDDTTADNENFLIQNGPGVPVKVSSRWSTLEQQKRRMCTTGNVQNFLKTARKDTKLQAVPCTYRCWSSNTNFASSYRNAGKVRTIPSAQTTPAPGFTAAVEFCCYLTFLAGCFFALRAKTCYCPAKCWKCISRRSCFHDDVLIKPCYSRANGDLTVGHYKTHFSTTTYL